MFFRGHRLVFCFSVSNQDDAVCWQEAKCVSQEELAAAHLFAQHCSSIINFSTAEFTIYQCTTSTRSARDEAASPANTQFLFPSIHTHTFFLILHETASISKLFNAFFSNPDVYFLHLHPYLPSHHL